MKASFDLAADLELQVAGNVPRTEHDPASVCLNVIHKHLPRLCHWETDLEVAASEAIDRYIANPPWKPEQHGAGYTQEEIRLLIAGNIRGLFGALNRARSAPEESTVLKPVLDLLRTPLMICAPIAATPGQSGWVQPPDETVISVSLVPSYARAIASAMLSAATEARR